tara:strand:+ start:75 stop:392 length:318 start_codon:yes stop_codon:yes gene_type:complete
MTELIPYILGPGGALITMAIIIVVGWRFSTKNLLPIFQNFLENIVTEHKEDRAAFSDSISLLNTSIGKIGNQVSQVDEKLDELDFRVGKVETQIKKNISIKEDKS